MTKLIYLIILCACTSLYAKEGVVSSPSVVIIGGGPAGLATALEAHVCGAQVTIVEKREDYSRMQRLFLDDCSLQLLERWKVELPQMVVMDIGQSERMGTVLMKNLEKALEKRVHELGIKKLRGEFKGFQGDEKKIIVSHGNEEQLLPYDFLVGADGAHSKVREKLGISPHRLGTATGVWVAVRHGDFVEEIDISDAIKQKDLFIRKITVPFFSIIFTQRALVPEKSSRQQLIEAVEACGWQREAKSLVQEEIHDNIEVVLQQVETFSDEKRGVILVGDAAATASFFQGRGVNTALMAASIAGNFFQAVREERGLAYHLFNQEMKKATDDLIEDSQFLFSQ